jgi:hypothetical protein
MGMTTPTDAQVKREQHRARAIARCNHTIMALNELRECATHAELNEISSQAEERAKTVLAEIQALRALVFTE